jgi:hypothetical protein
LIFAGVDLSNDDTAFSLRVTAQPGRATIERPQRIGPQSFVLRGGNVNEVMRSFDRASQVFEGVGTQNNSPVS